MVLPENYEYYVVNENTVRTNFQSKEDIEKWVSDLQSVSKTTWYITRTIHTPPEKAKKQVFKRIYHCHFKTKKNKLKNPRKREHPSRNVDCPAELVIVIKKQLKQQSKSKDVDIFIKDWPCVIIFNNNHNHTIDSAAALTKRPIGENTKQEILGFFEKGHSVASAYNSFCFKKMEELGDQYDAYVADRYYFPSKSDFSNLWRANFKNQYGERSGKKMFEQLTENLKQYSDTVYKIGHIGEDYAVSLCTPIMQRAAKHLIQSSEILFVDATSNCDVQNHKLYFFATQSPAGGMPLGCVITSSQKIEVFDTAVQNLIEIMPVKILPAVIVTDDDLGERSVLKKHWPACNLLLCTFHVLKSVWKWLQLSKNEIKKDDRQCLYQHFRNILMSKTEEQINTNLEVFEQSCKYPQYKKYIDSKLAKINSWCLYYRQRFTIRGADTNNYVEVMFRLFKDIPLERTKAYNVVQLTDFIISSFESYYKQRMLDLIMNKINRATLIRLSPNEKNVLPCKITEVGIMQYYVTSSSRPETKYFVDMNCNVCSCPEGITGKICKHQSSIIKTYNITNACNTLSEDSKKVIYVIATGFAPPPNLLLPLKLKNITTNEKIVTAQRHNSPKELNNDCTTSLNSVPTDSVPDDVYKNINEKWSNFIKQLDGDIRKYLNDDPDGFNPAVASFITNYQKNVTNSSTLMSGLYKAFKSDALPTSLSVRSRRKGKKISVQPTAVSRRKVKITGRRLIQAGRKVGNLRATKLKAPHALNACVKKNVGLGENKFVK